MPVPCVVPVPEVAEEAAAVAPWMLGRATLASRAVARRIEALPPIRASQRDALLAAVSRVPLLDGES